MTLTKRVQHEHLMPEEHRQAFFELIEYFPWLYSPILHAIDQNVTKDCHSLLDAGCGNGALLRALQKKHSHLRLSGIDIDGEALQAAKKASRRIAFMQQDVCDLDRKADVVVCNLSLHHFDRLEEALKSMIKSARKMLIISDQIRPETEQELDERLGKRLRFIREKLGQYVVPYCNGENERASILEAYSGKEILKAAERLSLPKPAFIDEDYYVRVVWIIPIHRGHGQNARTDG